MNQEQLFELMREPLGNLPLTIPPPSFKDLNLEVIHYEEGKSIEVAAPLYEKYNNPAGTILGGYIPTFFDLAYGPLSFLVTQKPTTSLDLNTTFIRPITVQDEKLIIKASVVNKGKSYLVLEAKAYNPEGMLVATSNSRMRILG